VDAPGYGDTARPDLDIAARECNSVKILALSGYRDVGGRGQ